MGAQDSFALAEDFVSATGTASFPMTWDESFETWSFYGVRGQPYAILLDSSGAILGEWGGAIPEDEILRLSGV